MDRWRIVTKRPEDERPHNWSKPMKLYPGRDTVINRMRAHRGKGFRIRLAEPNEQPGPIRELDELKRRLDERMQAARVGDTLVVYSVEDKHTVLIRKVDVEPPLHIVDIGANARVDRLHALIKQEFPNIESWGVCVRRFISGTTTWSQHSPWPPTAEANAEDLHSSTAVLDDVFRHLMRLRNEGEPVGLVLWRVAGHYDHLHYEAVPKMGPYPSSSCQ